MIRENLRLTILSVLLITFSAQAQVENEGEAPPAVEVPEKPIVPAGVAEAAGLKPTARPSPNRARQISMIKQFEGEITRALKMDEDQATEVNEIFRDFVEGLSEDGEDRREARRENAELIRELVEEMRDAQRDRDMEAVREIREEISELRGEHAEADDAIELDDLYDQLREVLTDDQIETFDPLADRLTKRLAGPAKHEKSKIRIYQKASNSINLPEEQLTAIRRIFVEFSKENRGAKGQAGEDAEAELLDSILDELDEDQARDFMQKVDELEIRMNGGSGDRRAERERRVGLRDKVAPVEDDVEEAGGADVEEVQDAPAEEDVESDEY